MRVLGVTEPRMSGPSRVTLSGNADEAYAVRARPQYLETDWTLVPSDELAELSDLRGDAAVYLRVCQALGVVHQADGHNDAPAPVDSVLAAIAELRRKAEAYDRGVAAIREDLRTDLHVVARQDGTRVCDMARRLADARESVLRHLGASEQTSSSDGDTRIDAVVDTSRGAEGLESAASIDRTATAACAHCAEGVLRHRDVWRCDVCLRDHAKEEG